jgi:hypothetical protein
MRPRPRVQFDKPRINLVLSTRSGAVARIGGMDRRADWPDEEQTTWKARRSQMLRKTILALAAGATIGAAALAPTSASAWGGYGGWHGGWHGGWRGWGHAPVVRVYGGPGYGGCMVRRWVYNPYGPALRWVNRCY